MDAEEMQDASGVHIWLVLMKAFHALVACGGEFEPEPVRPREPGVSRARSAAPQGTVAREYDWSESMAHAGVDQYRGRSTGEESACERKYTDDRRVRLVELTAER